MLLVTRVMSEGVVTRGGAGTWSWTVSLLAERDGVSRHCTVSSPDRTVPVVIEEQRTDIGWEANTCIYATQAYRLTCICIIRSNFVGVTGTLSPLMCWGRRNWVPLPQ